MDFVRIPPCLSLSNSLKLHTVQLHLTRTPGPPVRPCLTATCPWRLRAVESRPAHWKEAAMCLLAALRARRGGACMCDESPEWSGRPAGCDRMRPHLYSLDEWMRWMGGTKIEDT